MAHSLRCTALCYHQLETTLLMNRVCQMKTKTGIANIDLIQKRLRYVGPGHRGFYFPDRKMGREKEMSDESEMSTVKQMSEKIENLKRGYPKWKADFFSRLSFDKNLIMSHNDFEYLAKFNSDTVKQWSVTGDSETGVGYSTAEFITSPSGKGLFCGQLNLEPVQDGHTKKSGFCNISAPPNKDHFGNCIPYAFNGYTDLAFRVRGDGRNYMVVIQMEHKYSIHWYDMYHYPLYTRGGPYWQFVKIPFSKFYLTSCGRIQDQQHPMRLSLNCIRHIGITLADRVEGPFQLEIDYIALLRDENTEHNDFEYEMYSKDPYIV